MKKIFVFIIVILIVLTSCNNSDKNSDVDKDENGKVLQTYKGIYDTEVTNLNYLISSLPETREITYLLIDGLIDFDKYGKIVPCVADSWTISPDGYVYTFKLKEGLYWYTDENEKYGEVTAQDFVDSLYYILDIDNESTTSSIICDTIKNAKLYYNKTIKNFDEVGVKAIDKYTLEYTLEMPTPYFLNMISYTCFMPVNGEFLKELKEKEIKFAVSKDSILYNGAYILETYDHQDQKILVLNEEYWNKDLMSISKFIFKYNKEASVLGSELFLRGEATEVNLSIETLENWMKDETKRNYIQPKPPTSYTTYFGFNFDPSFDEEYEPDNWRIAVNNESFRKSLFYAINKKAAVMTVEPYNPDNVLLGTIIPKNFLNIDGTDYTELEPLKEYTFENSFDEKKALEYKIKAMKELDGKVNFPVTIVMPYNTSLDDWAKRTQVIKQQIENLLGTDYIKVEIVGHAPSGFNSKVRGGGLYSIMEMTWGADFADPSTFTDIFMRSTDIGWSYNRAFMALEYLIDYEYTREEQEVFNRQNLNADGDLQPSQNDKYPQLKDKKATYDIMVENAKSEVLNLDKRYELFAEAEAFLIEHAIVVPFYNSRGGYVASYCDPFSAFAGQFGRESRKHKGKVILEKPMTQEEYEHAQKNYIIEKETALSE